MAGLDACISGKLAFGHSIATDQGIDDISDFRITGTVATHFLGAAAVARPSWSSGHRIVD
jgi:hypothetical protein